MKRFVPSISAAACLLACAAAAAPAQLLHHKSKPGKATSADPLAGVTSKQPDKELFDKAMVALKKGRYDVARLDLQTLLNTYPESEFQMRAKLAIGDSWFKEGGTAALQQAEAEFKDFETFFPNAPEAAEAQMKVADIYYIQMEKPDRDPANAQRAQEEYRLMIQQFPDSTLVPRAKQRLREVQEVLADRQYSVGSFYATHENWPASIARLQTLIDSYPLYSHTDLALLQLGDAYHAEAMVADRMNVNKAAKERLISIYDDRAAEAYSQVVTRYPMAPHVEDARERLIGLGRPVPEASAAALAESEAEEGSRANVKLKDRAILLVKHGPNTVQAARVGEPTLVSPPVITAPTINKQNADTFEAAVNGKPAPPTSLSARSAAVAAGTAPPRTGDPAQIKMEDVPEGGSVGIGPTILNGDPGSAATVTDNNSGNTSSGSTPPAAKDEGGSAPTATPTLTGNPAPPENGGLTAVGPTNATPLPAVEKPGEAPMQVNDAPGGNTAQVQTGTTAGTKSKKKKNPKVKTDLGDESSSTKKKKKGVDKLNPF